MCEINPNIFKAYDIRGKYPDEINEETAELFGKAFVEFLRKKRPKIVVGRDNRASSLPLFKALTKGIIDQGGDVIDIGLSTSPMLYFAAGYYGFDGGVEITASHNPAEYNGFKVVREKAIPISRDSGLKQIKKFIFKNKFYPKKRGKLVKKKIISDYIKFVSSDFDFQKIKPFKIVVVLPRTSPSAAVHKILAKLPGKVYYSKHSNQDLGIAFDGDGDRIVFIDEKGKLISGDLITALVAKIILRKNPGKKILYDVRSSNVVKETIKENKGIAIIERVGHSFIKEKMRKQDIFFAGEQSGHYYLKSHYFCESPFFVLFKVLEEMSNKKNRLSELIKPFKKYYFSGEVNFKVRDKKKVLNKIEKKYKAGKISKIDGLRIDFKNWWFNVRPSNTEPVLRLVIEAETKTLLNKKKKEITKVIKL
ncbi:hypothetical protein AMJ49_04460 [Parcubacteria bacterium DG_74_2]|nr:MAG: hypothetical protein AMJ49_04460 [Parcubacteria bacterium DG_74_2]